jgi:hypothetical protein
MQLLPDNPATLEVVLDAMTALAQAPMQRELARPNEVEDAFGSLLLAAGWAQLYANGPCSIAEKVVLIVEDDGLLIRLYGPTQATYDWLMEQGAEKRDHGPVVWTPLVGVKVESYGTPTGT